MKHVLLILSIFLILFLAFLSLAQVDSTQIKIDQFVKETESITGSITKQLVQKDLTIQSLLQSNIQLAKENQVLKAQLEAKKKEEKNNGTN